MERRREFKLEAVHDDAGGPDKVAGAVFSETMLEHQPQRHLPVRPSPRTLFATSRSFR